MIDTEHFDMDTIDMEADQHIFEEDNCVICGKLALPNSMYCYDCQKKWGEV